MSRVLLAGVAVAGAVATTSAFTASNTMTAGALADDVAGYNEVMATGVEVQNIAYNPLGSNALMLDTVVFTVGESTNDMNALLTLSGSGGVLGGGAVTCTYNFANPAHQIICDVPNTVEIEDITKVGLTVVSK